MAFAISAVLYSVDSETVIPLFSNASCATETGMSQMGFTDALMSMDFDHSA